MQEITHTRSISQIGKGARKGAARQRTIRKPRAEKPASPVIISNGLLTLKLKYIPQLKFKESLSEGIVSELNPAYLHFCELMKVKPKKCTDEFAVIKMYYHIQTILGKEKLLDIYYDEDEQKHFFVYLTPLVTLNNYGTIFYEPVANLLFGEENKPYLTLFQKCLRSLVSIGVNDWGEYVEMVYDWMEEEVLNAEHSEEEDAEDLRYSLDMMQDIYLNGAAFELLETINYSDELEEEDLDFQNNGLDSKHSVCLYASELFQLLQQGKKLDDYTEEPDDYNDQIYLRFPEQFCIYYNLDELFFKHEEHINSLASEGLQEPRLVTKITTEMETVPMHKDSFPAEISDFFNRYSDLDKQISEYLKKEVKNG